MPTLIKAGKLTQDSWRSPNEDGDAVELAATGNQLLTESQWLQVREVGITAAGVQLEPGQSPAPLLDALDELAVVAIHFPVFADGRGFSYGRELRQRGYQGELRAVGNFIRDQLYYLSRCGFDAFQMDDDKLLQQALPSLRDFSDSYQACADQPLPLFRRR